VLVAGQGDRRKGTVFTYDRDNARLIEYDKASGDYRGQYRLAGGDEGWKDMRGRRMRAWRERGHDFARRPSRAPGDIGDAADRCRGTGQ